MEELLPQPRSTNKLQIFGKKASLSKKKHTNTMNFRSLLPAISALALLSLAGAKDISGTGVILVNNVNTGKQLGCLNGAGRCKTAIHSSLLSSRVMLSQLKGSMMSKPTVIALQRSQERRGTTQQPFVRISRLLVTGDGSCTTLIL